jgi:hypothetical protein
LSQNGFSFTQISRLFAAFSTVRAAKRAARYMNRRANPPK